MLDQSFRTMLANLEQQGELIRFDKEVDPLTNMAAVQWRAFNEMGKASLFTNVAGAAFPLVTNLFGTARRAELAFGTRPHQLIKRVADLAETLMPPTPAMGSRRHADTQEPSTVVSTTSSAARAS